MLKYDSVHGKFPGTVEAYDGGLIVNGKKYPVFTSMEVKDIPWLPWVLSTSASAPAST